MALPQSSAVQMDSEAHALGLLQVPCTAAVIRERGFHEDFRGECIGVTA